MTNEGSNFNNSLNLFPYYFTDRILPMKLPSPELICSLAEYLHFPGLPFYSYSFINIGL